MTLETCQAFASNKSVVLAHLTSSVLTLLKLVKMQTNKGDITLFEAEYTVNLCLGLMMRQGLKMILAKTWTELWSKYIFGLLGL